MEGRKTFSLAQALKFGFSAFTHHLPLLLTVSAIGIGVRLLYDVSIRVIRGAYHIPDHFPLPKNFSFGADQTTGLFFISLIFLCFIVIMWVITLGWLRIGLDLHDKNKSSVWRLLIPIRILGRVIGASVLLLLLFVGYGALVSVIFMVLYFITHAIGIAQIAMPVIMFFAIIPLIMLVIKYQFIDLAIVDTGCGSVESFRKSALITKNQKLPLLGAILAMLGITLAVMAPAIFLGMILGKIGALLGLMITILAQTVIMYVLFLARIDIYRQLQKIQGEAAPIPFD